ncbi:MAG: hypothetical protein ACREKL_05275 [Chthoniobacterales bacterium]
MSLRIAALLMLIFSGSSMAFVINEPGADRWMYPFNTTPGTRSAASVFGAVGAAGFDDRDGQFLVRFDTAPFVTPGLGASLYGVTSLTLTLTVNVDDSFFYDDSYDSYHTFGDPLAPGYVADADAGRPIELFAVGYRNGYSESTFAENGAFAAGNPMTEGARNAFAAQFNDGGALIDVSNNIAGAFEAVPLSIGSISGVAPGGLVPVDSVVTFDINLSNPFVVAWLQSSLNAGYLEFMVSSLYPTTQEASSGYPSFYTRENLLHDPDEGDYLAGQLSGVVAVPEPRAELLLAIGALCLLARRRRHA